MPADLDLEAIEARVGTVDACDADTLALIGEVRRLRDLGKVQGESWEAAYRESERDLRESRTERDALVARVRELEAAIRAYFDAPHDGALGEAEDQMRAALGKEPRR